MQSLLKKRGSRRLAAALLLIALAAAVWGYGRGKALAEDGSGDTMDGELVLYDLDADEERAAYPVREGDGFSIGFVHSVNKSPVTDYYEIRGDGIYVVKTVYYSFGAGVQTQLEGDEKLEYGDDGSMIVTGFDRRMNDLIYFVGTVSDHTLTIGDREEISLRDLCGRNAKIRFSYRKKEDKNEGCKEG